MFWHERIDLFQCKKGGLNLMVLRFFRKSLRPKASHDFVW